MITFLFQASDFELSIVQRVAMFVVAAISTILALTTDTVVGLFVLTADVIYVVVFPQLTCSVFFPFTNPYGSFIGYVLGVILRFGGGEPALELEPFIKYPFYDKYDGQLFPYKTLAMLCTFIAIITVSILFNFLFQKGYIPEKFELTRKIKIGVDLQNPSLTSSEHEPVGAYYNNGGSFNEIDLKAVDLPEKF